jgi:hypothetical protein
MLNMTSREFGTKGKVEYDFDDELNRRLESNDMTLKYQNYAELTEGMHSLILTI